MYKQKLATKLSFLSTLTHTCLRVILLMGLLAITPTASVLAGPPEPQAYLVKDLSPGRDSSFGFNLTEMKGTLFFNTIDNFNYMALYGAEDMLT